MNEKAIPRRRALEVLSKSMVGVWALLSTTSVRAATNQVLNSAPVKAAKTAIRNAFISKTAPKGYDPTAHHWQMVIDIDKCIGCGLCAEACKTENKVINEPFFFRTWIERYIIKKPKPGSDELRGETIVDSPNGGIGGFPPSLVPREEILKSFFVPKLCNECVDSPCVQACPVGATFDSPDGVVLIDPNYCIGCGFCIQACPYGCRFFNPETKTAEKCSLCYHRITRGLQPACVEVCPTETRMFGDLKNMTDDDPVRQFIAKNKVGVLKPHLGTGAKVLYAGLDKEVR
jgi:tetrathionate reductase subunit B